MLKMIATRTWRAAARNPQEIISDTSGNVAEIFALSLVVLLGMAGMAVDYGTAFLNEEKIQSALDEAVMSGVSAIPNAQAQSGIVGNFNTDQQLSIAKNFFDSSRPKLPPVDEVTFAFEGENLTGHATSRVETALLRVLGFETIDIAVSSAATSAASHDTLCFMAMHPTRKHTLELNGSVSVLAPDCNIYGNSSNFDDVVDPHTPENYITGKSVQAVGYGHHYIANVSPPLEHAPELIPDPLAALPIPAPGACQFNNTTVTSGTAALVPGVYCGGITVKGGANVTLNRGLYVISGGKFEVDSAQVSGDEVTIALADNSTTINWINSTVRLSAEKTGQYAGIVVLGVREEATHTLMNSTVDLHGVVYLLNGSFEWENTGTPVITSKWTAWIVDGISWDGDGTIPINFNLAASDVPYPQQLNVIPRPGSPRFVK
jgi:hypothetical protein